MLRRASGVVLLLLLPGVAAGAAERSGFLIGFTLGAGGLDCVGCESSGAAAFSFHLGASVSPRVSLAFEAFIAGHDEAFESRYSYQMSAIVQYWLSSRVWVGGGPGLGQNETQFGNISEWGDETFALNVQAGVEVWQRGRFALDLRGRYGRNFTDPDATDHIVALAGFTWY